MILKGTDRESASDSYLSDENGEILIDTNGVEEQSPIDQQAQDNYRIWKKNTPFFYDYISTNSLLWPSLTIQFFPDLEIPLPKGYNPFDNKTLDKPKIEYELSYQRLLHGTFTLGQSVDSISILQLPYYTNLNKCLNIDKLNYNHDKEEFELSTISNKRLKVIQKINHLGDVNKLRYMPQNPDVIASANNMGDLILYDRTKHANFKNIVTGNDSNTDKPELRLVNKNEKSSFDIFAFDWNKQKEGIIISGGMNGTLNLFDIKSNFISKDMDEINQSQSFVNGEGINDVEWNCQHDSIFGLVDDTGSIKLHDIRVKHSSVVKHKESRSINSISINPKSPTYIGTGDCEGNINIWDIRNFGSKDNRSIFEIKGHKESITQLKWHGKYHNIIGSSSIDKSVKLFDIGSSDDSNLLFVHAGHMLGVNDFDWSLHDEWLIASVANDNSLHVWKPAGNFIRRYFSS